MRKHTLFLLLNLTAVLQLFGAQNSLLKNGSFDKIVKNKPVYWGIHDWKDRSKITVVSPGYKAKNALCFNMPSVNNSRATFWQDNKVKIPAGVIVNLSGWYKTEDLKFGNKGQFRIGLILTPETKKERKKYLSCYLKSSEGKWTKFSKSWKADRNFNDLRVLGLFDKLKGSVMVSNISVELVTPQDKLVLFGFRKNAPLIDGKLDDPCWKNAQTANGFCKFGNPEPAAPDTKVKMCYDKQNIYFAVSAEEPLTSKIRGAKGSPWSGDCIEFFLAPDNKKYYWHIIVDCEGNLYTGINDGSERRTKLPIKAKTSVGNGQWTLEMSIPFANLKTIYPKDNTKWAFNTARVRRTAYPKTEISSWALLANFSEKNKFGKLAFYKNPEIEGDMAFWENSNRSGLMDRSEVSGIKIAREIAGKKAFPSLWDYSPFVKREKPANKWCERGLTQTTKKQFPEFYKTAMDFNALMIEKSFADEKLNMLFRAGAQQKERQALGKAFNNKRKIPMLKPLTSDIPKISKRIKNLDRKSNELLKTLQNKARKKAGTWTPQNLKAVSGNKYPNKFGYSRRFNFLAHNFFYNEESLMQLGPFKTHVLHPNFVSPKQMTDGSWNYDFLTTGADQRKNEGIMKRVYSGFYFGMHDLIVPMVPEIEKTPGVFMQSADKRKVHTKNVLSRRRAANIHSKALWDYTVKYLTRSIKEIDKRIPLASMDLFIFAQEAKNNFRVYNDKGKLERRSMGYTPEAGIDFHNYLKKRYGTISKLNSCWRSSYKSFADIKMPRDKFIHPHLKVTGLRFEHERWTRVTYLQWLSKIKAVIHKLAPGIPVMEDMSYFLLDGNLYLAFTENCADVMSFHSSPERELPMWNFMASINRKFDKLLGYYENYWGMFRRAHMNNEKLAKRDVDKFFFELFMQHINISGWWLRYVSHQGSYLASYNHGPYYLEYDQYIFRWSTTALPVMFQKGLSVEKMLLETTLKKSANAVIQPCTSVFALASQGYDVYSSPAVTLPFTLHNDFMRPLNIDYEFVPEEMLLDGKASLTEFKTIILPYAPYLSQKFSRQLKQWVADGGTLISIGPFAFYDAAGFAIAPEDSLLKTLFPKSRLGRELWDFSLSGQNTSPGITSKIFGKGSVIIFNRTLSVFNLNSDLKAKTIQVLKDNLHKTVTANVKNIRTVVRVSKDGTHWLAVNNTNVVKNMKAAITINGKFSTAYDVTIPGWIPIPVTHKNGKSVISLSLRPGDWTVVKLK
jgi:hypothetical protein